MAAPASGRLWRHRIYGLELESNRPLGPLPSASGGVAADVCIEMAGVASVVKPADSTLRYTSHPQDPEGAASSLWEWDSRAGTCMHLRYGADGDYADFVVNPEANRVRVSWTAHAHEENVITLLLGPVLGLVLRRRGTTCFHASAIAVDGCAVAISGPSGGGKSTLAAALARKGFATLGDEIAVLTETQSSFVVHPGEPRLRLWPRIVEQFWGSAAELPHVLPGMEKRWLPLGAADGGDAWRHCDRPLPLAAVYVIGQRSRNGQIRIEPFSWSAATMVLATQLYLGSLGAPSQRSAEFARLGRLAARVPVRRLHMPEQMARIEDGAAALVDDARSLPCLREPLS